MPQTIALLGLGRMGQGIASRLLANGFDTVIWNRSREKAARLLDKGARWAESPAAAAGQAGMLISMVADDNASSAILLGPEGALATMPPHSFLVECSTLSRDYVLHLSGEAQKQGIRYIDCPVTGWPEFAEAGTLTLLTGADPKDLEEAKPVLQTFSKKIRYFGGVGAGTAYKLMINLMGAVQIAALAEGLALAESLGLDKEAVIEAIETSAAASPQVIKNTRKMATRQFDDHPPFTLALRYKDTRYGVSLAKSMNSSAPLGETALAWFAQAAGSFKSDPGSNFNSDFDSDPGSDPGIDEATVIRAMTT